MTQAPPPGPDNPQGYPASAPPPPPVDPAGQQPAPGYAAPPPPAGGYAAPPPPAAGGYPAAPQGQQPAASGPQISFDASKVALGDWIFFGVGLLMLIFSFFGWVSSSYASTGGWNGWPVIIQLLLLITLGIRAAQVFAGKLQREIPAIAQIIGAGLITLLSIVALIQIFSETSGSGVASSVCDGLTGESLGACRAAVSDAADQYSIGPGFGIWAYLILSIALVYLLVLQLQKEKPVPFKVPSVGGL